MEKEAGGLKEKSQVLAAVETQDRGAGFWQLMLLPKKHSLISSLSIEVETNRGIDAFPAMNAAGRYHVHEKKYHHKGPLPRVASYPYCDREYEEIP